MAISDQARAIARYTLSQDQRKLMSGVLSAIDQATGESEGAHE